jgi:hypothetical protein
MALTSPSVEVWRLARSDALMWLLVVVYWSRWASKAGLGELCS